MTDDAIMIGRVLAIVAALWAALPAGGAFVDQMAAKYDSAVHAAALRHGLDPALIHAVIRAESGYNRWAVSSAGAQGLMQLMPATADFYGVADPFKAEDNIDGGVRYLRDLSTLYDGRTDLILAAYNAGQSAVEKYKGVPPYAETRAYVETVKAALSRERGPTKTRIFSIVDASGRTIVTNVSGCVRGNGR